MTRRFSRGGRTCAAARPGSGSTSIISSSTTSPLRSVPRAPARPISRWRAPFLFLQAEGGIRYWSVTGVQTCALPISPGRPPRICGRRRAARCGYSRAAASARRSAVVALEHKRLGFTARCYVDRRLAATRRVAGLDRKGGGEGKREDLGGGRSL